MRLRLKVNLRLKAQKLRALLPLKIPMTTTMTTSSKLILASMAMAVVSALMLLDCDHQGGAFVGACSCIQIGAIAGKALDFC